MPTIRKMLDLSLDHLTPRQRLYGDRDGDIADWGSAVVNCLEHGFLLWVPNDPKESSDATEEPVPPNLLRIQLYAREHDCDYVLFDVDAEPDVNLPVYEPTESEDVPPDPYDDGDGDDA